MPMERQIRGISLGRRLAALALGPLTEELIWRGVAVGALIALAAPFGAAVTFSVLLAVAAHHNAFTLDGLLKGVAPSSVGIALAYYLTSNLWVAILVHLAADVEILFPLHAADAQDNDGMS